ncbi:MAG: M23 family metallopeptidase [Bacilli bacterium]|nr:M23 family metallopeptidase [Bacilli bacterium]MDD4808655.1 M23 family metallopeptidase [Bacilli bacterium]
MKNVRLKKSAVMIIYGLSAVILLTSIYIIESMFFKGNFKEKDDYDYVSKTIFEDEDIPVVGTTKVIIKPYVNEDIKVLKRYYDYKADENEQKEALIYHEDTYLQSSGIIYGDELPFDVVSILDGTVIQVKKDNTLGNVVQVRHSNEVISIYQSLGEVLVKENETIKQGQVISKSGSSNLNKKLGNHLLFELIINGRTVNPEDYYDKKVDDL